MVMARKPIFAKKRAGWAKHKKNFDYPNFNKIERQSSKLEIKKERNQ